MRKRSALEVVLLGAVGLVLGASFVEARSFYHGFNSSEAGLEFEHWVELRSDHAPSESETMDQIDSQISHLYGTMYTASRRAGINDDYSIEDVRMAPKPGQPGVYVASYRFTGTILLENGGSDTEYELLLPRDPDTIYEESLVRYTDGSVGSPCVEYGHGTVEDFYYYWNPLLASCWLREGVNFFRVTGRIRRRPNTRVTYPDYPRLLDASGRLTISLLMGMDEESNSWNPLVSGDSNAANFRNIRAQLLHSGYSERIWSEAETRKFLGDPKDGEIPLPFVEEFTKQGKRAPVTVRAFFGGSSLYEGHAQAFHRFLKDSLLNSSVMIYGGHSGYGANSDLRRIEKLYGEKIRMSLNRYQLFFFSSCSSYGAYNREFFLRKRSPSDPKGTRNLDVLTTGLATRVLDIDGGVIGLLGSLDDWLESRSVPGYPEIVRRMEYNNLVGVNGDEDNPTAPPR